MARQTSFEGLKLLAAGRRRPALRRGRLPPQHKWRYLESNCFQHLAQRGQPGCFYSRVARLPQGFEEQTLEFQRQAVSKVPAGLKPVCSHVAGPLNLFVGHRFRIRVSRRWRPQ